ncbi:hypothetical protein ACQ46_gp221 [Citrobacter phage Moon]|uniref:Uncharacterized protein n=2 Tax=Moonvirus TaxID=1985329 RepID=A0A2H4YG19_9CAUD|nr:hypothetical protein ACQ46_gp221 [Citrobacter phage Moon]YP_009618297.1 hypothetical protein FDI95_gp222 [Citrobacter phage CF1 ERZ-2017]AIX12203.1 hypothetical protein CPT_Moon232 [Citrobacter phage Moon]AUE23111.1 hypothetical protein Cf1_00248 [Citrobacter phage CF1 ERZ-2017]
MITFEKTPEVVVSDMTEEFIFVMETNNIRCIKVPPTYVIERLNCQNAGEIMSKTTTDYDYVVNQFVALKPDLVLVREVKEECIGDDVRYIFRVDYIKVRVS